MVFLMARATLMLFYTDPVSWYMLFNVYVYLAAFEIGALAESRGIIDHRYCVPYRRMVYVSDLVVQTWSCLADERNSTKIKLFLSKEVKV